jgi:integrase
MATVPLTDAFIRSFGTGKGRDEVFDARCPGLSIRVTKSGVKSWSYRYRDRESGKVERLSIGRYPAIPLAKAREIADEKRVSVAKGGSPRKEARKARAAYEAAMTVDALCDKFMAAYVAKKTPKSEAGTRSVLNAVRAEFGKRKAKEIERLEVIAFLRRKAETAPIAANRTLSAMSKLFGWAVDEGYLETTPVVRIAKPSLERARERILSDPELRVLWRAFDDLDFEAMTLAFRFLALTGQRAGEVLGMEVSELHDLSRPSDARWELPSARAKNGRTHIVPLPRSAREIVLAALKLREDKRDTDSPFVFVSRRNSGDRFDSHSLARAMKRLVLGLHPEGDDEAAVKSIQANHPTPHDFRRTMVTGLGRLGFRREDVKALVNHAEGDITERHYDRYDRLPEKRACLAAWERHVMEAVGETEPEAANVVVLGARR